MHLAWRISASDRFAFFDGAAGQAPDFRILTLREDDFSIRKTATPMPISSIYDYNSSNSISMGALLDRRDSPAVAI